MIDKELQKEVGKRIREIRKLNNISQLDLAYSIGMSINTISYIELGKIAPKIDTLNKIANQLAVSVGEFFQFCDINSDIQENREAIKKIVRKIENYDIQRLDKILKIVSIL